MPKPAGAACTAGQGKLYACPLVATLFQLCYLPQVGQGVCMHAGHLQSFLLQLYAAAVVDNS